MSLGWMFYLADISQGIFGIFAILSGILCFALCMLIMAWFDNADVLKLIIAVTAGLFLSLLIVVLVPSKSTIYAFGAQYAIEDIATMPETKQVRETLTKFLEVVDSKLDEELKAK